MVQHECLECEYETESMNGLKIHFSKSHPDSDKNVAKYHDEECHYGAHMNPDESNLIEVVV